MLKCDEIIGDDDKMHPIFKEFTSSFELTNDLKDSVYKFLSANNCIATAVADKIAWDQEGEPPFAEKLHKSLKHSLRHAAFTYINYLWERKDSLKVIHPWLRDAYEELKYIV